VRVPCITAGASEEDDQFDWGLHGSPHAPDADAQTERTQERGDRRDGGVCATRLREFHEESAKQMPYSGFGWGGQSESRIKREKETS
jgi:hypothetical protein